MVEKWSNRATSTLATGISNSDLSITLATGEGALFPTLGTGDYFYGVLETGSLYASTTREIVKVTARSGDVCTIVRAQDGTSALAFAGGSRFELRVVRASLNELRDRVSGGTLTARYNPPHAIWCPAASNRNPYGLWGSSSSVGDLSLTTTSQLSSTPRSIITVTSAAATGVRGNNKSVVFRGNAAGLGGFRFEGKWVMVGHQDSTRHFTGLAVSPSAFILASGNPSTLTGTALFGFGWDSTSLAASDNIRFFHNVGTGGPVTDLDTGISRATATTNLIYFRISAPSNSNGIRIILKALVTGTLFDQFITTNIPSSTDALNWQWSAYGNGGASSASFGSAGSEGRAFPWRET